MSLARQRQAVEAAQPEQRPDRGGDLDEQAPARGYMPMIIDEADDRERRQTRQRQQKRCGKAVQRMERQQREGECRHDGQPAAAGRGLLMGAAVVRQIEQARPRIAPHPPRHDGG